MEAREDRKNQIQLLKRQQNRKNQLPDFLQQVSIITSKTLTEDDVLTLEEIDNHRISINCTDFDFNFLNLSYPKEESAKMFEVLQILAKEIQDENYLVLPKWFDIAILKTETGFLLSAYLELIRLDGNSFHLYTLDYKNGFHIDFFNEWWYLDGQARERPILELRVFGKEWIKRIAASL